MLRLVIAATALSIVVAGCGSTWTEAEAKREAFRLSHVPQGHKSSYLKANSLIRNADAYLREGLAATEKKNKVKYLTSAASKYSKAIDILKRILAETKEPDDRDFISHVIEDTSANREEAVNSMPILD